MYVCLLSIMNCGLQFQHCHHKRSKLDASLHPTTTSRKKNIERESTWFIGQDTMSPINRFFVLFFIGLYCYRLNNQCVTCCAERGTATNSTATDCCHCHPETGKRKHDCNRIIDNNKDMTLIKSSAFHGCLSVRVHLKKNTD